MLFSKGSLFNGHKKLCIMTHAMHAHVYLQSSYVSIILVFIILLGE